MQEVGECLLRCGEEGLATRTALVNHIQTDHTLNDLLLAIIQYQHALGHVMNKAAVKGPSMLGFFLSCLESADEEFQSVWDMHVFDTEWAEAELPAMMPPGWEN